MVLKNFLKLNKLKILNPKIYLNYKKWIKIYLFYNFSAKI